MFISARPARFQQGLDARPWHAAANSRNVQQGGFPGCTNVQMIVSSLLRCESRVFHKCVGGGHAQARVLDPGADG